MVGTWNSGRAGILWRIGACGGSCWRAGCIRTQGGDPELFVFACTRQGAECASLSVPAAGPPTAPGRERRSVSKLLARYDGLLGDEQPGLP